MPSSSLNKMTVPLASDQSSSSQGLLMPKLRYRFRVMFENFGANGVPTTELTKQVVSFARPNLSFEPIQLPIYNTTIKLATNSMGKSYLQSDWVTINKIRYIVASVDGKLSFLKP